MVHKVHFSLNLQIVEFLYRLLSFEAFTRYIAVDDFLEWLHELEWEQFIYFASVWMLWAFGSCEIGFDL